MAKESIFVITIRVNFDTISKLGTDIYYIVGLRTDNGIGTIQYIPVLYIFIYITFLPEHVVSMQWHDLLI